MKDSFDIILTSSIQETRGLYRVIKYLFMYPETTDVFDKPDPKGLLYEIAFAQICGEYLKELNGNPFNEDLEKILITSGIISEYNESGISQAEADVEESRMLITRDINSDLRLSSY